MKIFQASKSLAALEKQFAAAGLKIDDFINASDETALQAHLESLRPAAPAPVDAASARAEAVKPYVAALAATGVQVKAADEQAGPTAAEIEQALRARASILAAEQLAKHGLPAALPVAPAADATRKTAAKTLTREEWRALDTHARAQFFRDGGRLDSAA